MYTISLTIQDLDFATPEAAAVAFRNAINSAPGLLYCLATDQGGDTTVKVELHPFEQANDTVDALVQAEGFVSGFEDDELQEGIPELLAGLRSAIQRERCRPAILDALKELRSAALGYQHETYLKVSKERTNMLSATLLLADKVIKQAEGRANG